MNIHTKGILVENGESIECAIVELLKPPFKFSELVLFIESLIDFYKDGTDDWSEIEIYDEVVELWNHYEKKYNIIKLLDDKIDLPIWAEPWDELGLKLIIDKVIIGVGVKYLIEKLAKQ